MAAARAWPDPGGPLPQAEVPPVAGAHRRPDLAGHASDAFFLILVLLNVARTLHHAMWRDELQIFQLGSASASPWELFVRLRYEAHGELWDGLVWMVTRFTSDPAWMQVLHAALAIVLWIVIYRWSPFGRTEKFLLLLSYFLFFEYFVVSRSYVLAVLLGLSFVAVRHHRPGQGFVPWLLLGLMANLVMHATIWSMALAIGFVLEERRRDPAFLGGAAVYLGLLAFGIATMTPAADYGPWGNDIALEFSRLDKTMIIPVGAFLPVNPGWLKAAFAFITGAAAAPPHFSNPNPASDIVALTSADTAHPLRLAALLAAPVVVSWLVTRKPLRVLEFTLAYGGILTFATLWDFPGGSRHHGIVFLALVAGAWLAQVRSDGDGVRAWVLRAVLLVSAIGGVLTLSSELRPFSQSRNAARWLEHEKLAGGYLIGSRDAQASAVAGYLARPLYYLECACNGTFIVWNHARTSMLSADQFRTRLARALDLAGGRDAILIRNRPLAAGELPAGAGLAATLLQSFEGAETDENFWIYRVVKAAP